MKIGRRWLLAMCPVALVAGLASLPLQAQTAAPSPAPAAIATAAPAQSAPQQAYTLPPEKLAKAIALSRIRVTLGIAGAFWGIVFLGLLLSLRAWVAIERWTERLSGRRWVQGLGFFAAFFLVTTLAGLPLDAIAHHFERAYGISVQAWGSWLGDQAKALGLTLLVGVPILLLFHWIVRRWPRRYWLAGWVVTLPILAFSIFLEPLFEPIFFHFEPLQKNHAALVSELEKVAARTGTNIPPSRMVLMKASVKTNGLNAYVSGLGATKRIVVWDTTAGRIPDDEVLFIFGHESGHYVLHHIAKGFAGSAVGLFFVYWACAAFAAWLVKRFGARWIGLKPEDLIHAEPALASRTGFVVLLFAISIAGFLTEPVVNAVSRHFERQADVYGQEAIHGIVADPERTAVAAFNDLGAAWLEDPHPNPILVFWLYDHPSIQQRAEFAAHYNPWANGGRGEFFKK
jgi:Zn-dependent protease with chaperone function